MKVVGVVLAGGSGRRAGLGRDKVLVRVGDRSVLERSVAAIAGEVDDVVVVARPVDREEVARLLGGDVAAVVDGGSTRHDSEAAGLVAAATLGATTVAVHDGARPLVSAAVVRRVVEAARTGVAAVPGLPRAVPIARWGAPAATVHDVGTLLDRGRLVGVQTPQAAPLDVLRAAFDLAAREDDPADQQDTVAPVLRHRSDVPVVLVSGDERNVKLTWAADVGRTERLLERDADDAVGRLVLRRRRGRPTGGAPPVDLEVDGVVPVTDALRAVDGQLVVAGVDRTGLVDVAGDLLAAPGVIGDDEPDLAAAVERAVADGALLRLRRRR